MISRFLRRHAIALAILALALALRLINLGGRPLWYDEAFAVLYAEKPVNQIVYGTISPIESAAAADVHPLLYYLGLHAWIRLAGQSPAAVRLPSVLFGVATVWLIGLLGQATGGRRMGNTAMLLAAVAPFPVAYSQEARMYSLLALCVVGAVYCAWRARENRTWWAGYTVCSVLALYSHNLGALTMLALTLLLLAELVHARNLVRLRWFLAANLAILALFSPWLLLVLPGQIGFVQQAYWVPRPGLTELVRSLIVYHFNLPLPSRLLPPALFGAVFVLLLLLYRTAKLRARIPAAFLWLGLAPLAMMWLVSQWQPIFIERAMLPAALLYTVAVAWLLAAGELPRWLLTGVCGLCLLVSGLSLEYHYRYTDFPRAPYAEAIAYLQANAGPQDAIVHSNKLTFFPMHYYDREMPAEWIADPAGDGSDTLARPTQEALGLYPSPDMETAVSGARRVWLIIFDRAIGEYGGRHPHLMWLEAGHDLAEAHRFNQLQVLLFVESSP
jgi:uncharacterized membrane protein